MKRILVVEDEPRIALMVARKLRAAGHEAETEGDGAAALRRARTGRFDLLILDLGLPGMDGLEVLHSLRAADHGLPVMVVTARGGDGGEAVARAAGADAYLKKPFRLRELVAEVDRMVAATEPAGEGWRERLRATLTLDTGRTRPAFAGVRSGHGGPQRHLVYSTPAVDVVLDLSQQSSELVRVMGQVLDAEGRPDDYDVRIVTGASLVGATRTDELGEFAFDDVRPGLYELQITSASVSVSAAVAVEVTR